MTRQASIPSPSGPPIGPSDLVDIGWHTFILYTREYAEFCERVAGRFIHHVPDDVQPDNERDRPTLADSVEAIRAAGYQIDPQLWSIDSAECTQCHAGCHDSPTG
ncbi:hypothetical protein KRMM14A1004_32060 [Krasilnikovia sp. MM14-A1004]